MGPPKFDADLEDRVRYLRIGRDGVLIGGDATGENPIWKMRKWFGTPANVFIMAGRRSQSLLGGGWVSKGELGSSSI